MKSISDIYSNGTVKEITAYKKLKFNLKKVTDLIHKYVENPKGKELLDVGCADGSFAAHLRDNYGFQVFGVDIVKEAIKKANKLGVLAMCWDLTEKLPYRNNSFDVITMCETIEHIFYTDFLIEELYRILKPNGYLFVTTPNIASISTRIKLLLGIYPLGPVEYYVRKGHIRTYNQKVMKLQLENHKFKVIKQTAANFIFPVKNKKIPYWIKNIMVKLSDLCKNIGEQIIVVAKK